MIYKTTSVKRVISKVFTDLDLQEGEHRIADMIEWAGEALEKIGAFPSLITKITGKDDIPVLEIENYQAKLPCDFHSLIQIGYSTSKSGPFYPLRYGTGSFDQGVTNTEAVSDYPAVVSDSSIVTYTMSLYSLSYEDALEKINNEPATRELIEGLLTDSTSSGLTSDVIGKTSDYTYVIKSGYIKTNVRDGYLMVAYQAVPTDDEGYPLIPDDVSFIEALYWYITMKLYYPQWKSGLIRDAVFYDARRSWNYYCKQAYGNAMMPDAGQMESIKNTWLRLVPELDEADNAFSTLGQRQFIFNKNK